MQEREFSNPEIIQQRKISAGKTEESPTEEKTSEVLDAAEKQKAKAEEIQELKQKLEKGVQEGKLLKSAAEKKKVVLTPEQEKDLQRLRQELRAGARRGSDNDSFYGEYTLKEIKKFPISVLDSFPDIKENVIEIIVYWFNGSHPSKGLSVSFAKSGLVKPEDYKELLVKKIAEKVTGKLKYAGLGLRRSAELIEYFDDIKNGYSLKNEDLIENKEIQNKIIEFLENELHYRTFQSILDTKNELQLPEQLVSGEDFQRILLKKLYRLDFYFSDYFTKEFIAIDKLLSPERCGYFLEEVVDQFAQQRNYNAIQWLMQESKTARNMTNNKVSEIIVNKLGKDKELTNLFIENLSEKYQQPEMLKKIIIKLLENKEVSQIAKVFDKYSVSAEITSDAEIQKLATNAITNILLYNVTYFPLDKEIVNDSFDIAERFNLPPETFLTSMVCEGAKKIYIKYLCEGSIYEADYIKEMFNFTIPTQELINESPEVQNLLSQIKEISPEFYEQALKSVDIIISLFPLAKNPEQVLKIIEKNPFLVDAVRENPRFGSKLLVKYPEFDKNSKENIEFMYNAKKEILEENPDIDPESLDFRIAMQKKLKNYKNNPEILRQIESRGIDVDRWLNYSEAEYFSLDSGQSKLAFSETVATPINRIKETIASYSYRVKEVIKEYQKEFKGHKIKAGNVDETSELIKKMEGELAKAKEEGNEAKVKGIEKGIAGFQEKMKKGKEIPLWDKVIGDINAFDRLKNDVFLSHENVIKAEEEFKECSQDKSRAAMDIIEAKRLLAKAKEELKEKFGLLDKRIEDFNGNLISVFSPALGKDRAESLFQEIQEGLGEQFNHYNADRSTLSNLFSERSDKEKEKLDSRPMSIFVGARNPDVDLYQGNYSPCCICIESEHMGANSTIADYNTDLGIQIVNIWDETKNEPITAAWCWIGDDVKENTVLVVDNIESNTLYSANYSEQLTEKLFDYLRDYAKSIGVKKVVQGKANNDLPAASELAKMNSDNKEYYKVGGYNREGGYFLEAEDEDKGVKVIWEKKVKKREKKERKKTPKIEIKNREIRPFVEEDLQDILELEEHIYGDENLFQGQGLIEDIKSGKGLDYSMVLTGERKAGEKEIIGYAVGIEDETDEGKPCIYLEDIAVSPIAQGQGFGWEIMKKMIEKLKEKAAKENKTILFDMHLRDNSRGLIEKHKEDLERLGLRLVDEALVPGYYDENEDALYQVYEISGEE